MLKKLISLLLALSLVLSISSVSFAFSDTDGTDYEEAVYVLSELEIIDGYKDKTFRPENSITRAEFAAMVVRLVDTTVYNIPEEQVFTDVDKKHWAYEFVNAGFHIGYFSGYGDGIFAPEEKISFSEVVKTITTILGYKPLAEARGGYPTGYVMIANEKDLLDGLSLGNDEYVTRGDVALLLYNSLNKPKLEQTVFGDDKIEYTEDPRRTILTDELKVSRYEGVITATRHTGLYGVQALYEDEILIGDTKLAVGKSDIVSMLGYNLVVYAKEDKKTKDETVIFYEIKEENDVTTVVADDIDPSTNLNYFSFWNGEKQESIAFSNDAQFIINAKYEPLPLSDDLKPDSGTVTLLSNDGDRNVDVVIVKDYTHYVVKAIDTKNLVIYDEYDKAPLELEPADKNVDYTIIRGSSAGKFSQISMGSVLAVSKSVDGEYMEIVIIQGSVKGKVVGTEDSDTYIIGQEEKEYKRSADLPDSVVINIGDEGTFYLDIEGKIVKADIGSSTKGNYLYVMDAGITSGLGAELQLKVLTSKGKIETLIVAQNATFNGNRESKESIIAYLGGAGTITQQPIRYALNAEGKISKIETPSLDFTKANRPYRRNLNLFGFKGSAPGFFADADTVIFGVPTAGGADEYYKIIQPTDLDVWRDSPSTTGYDLDGLTVGCVVLDEATTESVAKITGTCAVLSKVTEAVDKDGDPCYKIYYMKSGAAQEKIVSDKVTVGNYAKPSDTTPTTITMSDLKPGDVIHVKTDGQDEVISIARILSVNGKTLSELPKFSTGRASNSNEFAFGVAYKRIGTGLLLDVGAGLGSELIYEISKITDGDVYLYDSRTETVRKANYNDVFDIETAPGNPAYLLIRAVTGVVEDIVIYYQD